MAPLPLAEHRLQGLQRRHRSASASSKANATARPASPSSKAVLARTYAKTPAMASRCRAPRDGPWIGLQLRRASTGAGVVASGEHARLLGGGVATRIGDPRVGADGGLEGNGPGALEVHRSVGHRGQCSAEVEHGRDPQDIAARGATDGRVVIGELVRRHAGVRPIPCLPGFEPRRRQKPWGKSCIRTSSLRL
jgi:hypothetical protein